MSHKGNKSMKSYLGVALTQLDLYAGSSIISDSNSRTRKKRYVVGANKKKLGDRLVA